MSDLQRDFLRAKLAKLPAMPPPPPPHHPSTTASTSTPTTIYPGASLIPEEDDDDDDGDEDDEAGDYFNEDDEADDYTREDRDGESDDDDDDVAYGEEYDDFHDTSSTSSASSTSTIRPLHYPPPHLIPPAPQKNPPPFLPRLAKKRNPRNSAGGGGGGVGGGGKYDPVGWEEYWKRNLKLEITSTSSTTTPESTSTANSTPTPTAIENTTPTTTTTTFNIYITPPATPKEPLFIFHHGAGSSGLSFSLLARELVTQLPGAGCLAFDARGHGGTITRRAPTTTTTAPGAEGGDGDEEGGVVEGESDLGLERLSEDLVGIVERVRREFGWDEEDGGGGGGGGGVAGGNGKGKGPPLVLVGHSMGGAVVVDVVSLKKEGEGGKLRPRLEGVEGYVVLDVVEGSAIDALQSMHTYLISRPSLFPTLTSGIEWHVRSRTIRNPSSARVSVPGLLIQQHTNEAFRSQGIGASGVKKQQKQHFTWRTNLSKTQPFWEGWFVGLSRKFLEGRGGKLLVLAGTDRLDKELMIGQMQGKYQLLVIPDVGHFVHEDAPERTASALVEFHKRQAPIVLPPKVGAAGFGLPSGAGVGGNPMQMYMQKPAPGFGGVLGVGKEKERERMAQQQHAPASRFGERQ